MGSWCQPGMMPDLIRDDDWPALLARCAAVLDLEASARAYGAFQRPRGVRSAAALLRLALGYGPGGLSRRQAAAWAEVGGLAALSPTALMNRLRHAADWLGALAGALVAGRVPAPDALGRRPLCLVDGSALSAPGGRTADWRLHVAYDPCAQRFTALDLTDAGGAERLDRAPVTPDQIRIADRGYATRPEGVRALTEGPGDYAVRVGWRGLHRRDPAGGRFDVLAFLAGLGAADLGEAAVLVGRARQRRGFAPVPARLIALRLPPEAAARARRRAERASPAGAATASGPGDARGGRVPAAADQPRRAGLSGRAGGRAVPAQVAGRAGDQAAEVPAAYRPAAGQEPRPGAGLALRPPDRGLAGRRPGAGRPPGRPSPLPPGRAGAAGRAPSLWRLVESLARAVVAAVLGPRWSLRRLIAALPRLRRHFCDPPRKRRLQMQAWLC